MIPLTGEFENFVDVLISHVEATCILILIFHINFNFKLFKIRVAGFSLLHFFTFGVIEAFFMQEFEEESFWDVVIGHGIPGHFQLIEVSGICQNVRVHALVVHQMDFETVVQLDLALLILCTQRIANLRGLLLIFGLNYPQTRILL